MQWVLQTFPCLALLSSVTTPETAGGKAPVVDTCFAHGPRLMVLGLHEGAAGQGGINYAKDAIQFVNGLFSWIKHQGRDQRHEALILVTRLLRKQSIKVFGITQCKLFTTNNPVGNA